MDNKLKNVGDDEKDITLKSAELNGVKVNAEDYEMPRTTFEMLEQTCQIA